MRVNAVAYFRVIDPNRAITEVENFLVATSQISQTTLRSVLGKAELDALLSERERLNIELQQIIDEQTEPWGVKVSTVEVKDVELPQDMQRAIARQAEAERERRAKIIAADGEFQAAEKLSQAAEIFARNPATLQLRYLQTLLDIGVNQNSTIVFPLPIDLLKPFLEPQGAATARARARARRAHRPLSDPEIRIDQLTGLRAILAPGRAERPDAFAPAPPRPREDAAETCPFCEGREDRTPPEVWARRPGGGAADSPGWTQRAVPNLYPVLGRRAPTRRPAARGQRGRGRAGELRRPAAGLEPGDGAGPVRLDAGRGCPRGDRSLPGARDLARRALRGALRRRRGGLAGADARRRRGSLVRPPDRQRGSGRGRLAGALACAALRAALRPAAIARERERASAYHERTMGGHLLSEVATEEVRRRERLVAVDDEALLICPWASRSPFELRVVPRRPGALVRARRRDRHGDDSHRASRPGRAVRLAAAAQSLGAHRTPRASRSSAGTSTWFPGSRCGPASSSAPGSRSTSIRRSARRRTSATRWATIARPDRADEPPCHPALPLLHRRLSSGGKALRPVGEAPGGGVREGVRAPCRRGGRAA